MTNAPAAAVLAWARRAPLRPARYATVRRQRLALLTLATLADDAGNVAGGHVDELRAALDVDERGERRVLEPLVRAGLVTINRDARGHRLGYELAVAELAVA